MQISLVSLAGADASINPRSLIELAKNYPFVEFGILFSETRQDSERYPSRNWISEFTDLVGEYQIDTGRKVNLAAHLCGEYARQFIRGHSEYWLEAFPEDSLYFDRIQLNITDESFMDLEFVGLVTESQRNDPPWKEVIIQTKRAFERSKYLSLANDALGGRVSLIYDASGGKGKFPKSWPAAPTDLNVRCGYAGGISPLNVESVLQELKRLPDGLHTSWIDMETGVRDNSIFSYEKCELVLSASKPYVLY